MWQSVLCCCCSSSVVQAALRLPVLLEHMQRAPSAAAQQPLPGSLPHSGLQGEAGEIVVGGPWHSNCCRHGIRESRVYPLGDCTQLRKRCACTVKVIQEIHVATLFNFLPSKCRRNWDP